MELTPALNQPNGVAWTDGALFVAEVRHGKLLTCLHACMHTYVTAALPECLRDMLAKANQHLR